jgi:hypothetical protein
MRLAQLPHVISKISVDLQRFVARRVTYATQFQFAVSPALCSIGKKLSPLNDAQRSALLEGIKVCQCHTSCALHHRLLIASSDKVRRCAAPGGGCARPRRVRTYTLGRRLFGRVSASLSSRPAAAHAPALFSYYSPFELVLDSELVWPLPQPLEY